MNPVAAGCSKTPPVAPTPPVEVVVSQPVQEQVVDWDTYTGTVAAKESVEVRARVRGHIKEVRFTEGDEIEAGRVESLQASGVADVQPELIPGVVHGPIGQARAVRVACLGEVSPVSSERVGYLPV